MAMLLDQVLARIGALAGAAAPAGTAVHIERVAPISREEAPAVNVQVREVSVEPFGDDMDRLDAIVELRITVRDDAPTGAADAVHAPVHQAVIKDPVLRSLVDGIRSTGATFERDDADLPSLVKVAGYRVTALVPKASH